MIINFWKLPHKIVICELVFWWHLLLWNQVERSMKKYVNKNTKQQQQQKYTSNKEHQLMKIVDFESKYQY